MNKYFRMIISGLLIVLNQTISYGQTGFLTNEDLAGIWKYAFDIPGNIAYETNEAGYNAALNGNRSYKLNDDMTLSEYKYENENFIIGNSTIYDSTWPISGNFLVFKYKMTGSETLYEDKWAVEFESGSLKKVTGVLISTSLPEKSGWINKQKIYCVKIQPIN